MRRWLWLGFAGGLLAGTGVGLAEAVWVLSQAPTGEYLGLVQAAVLYGATGAVVGLISGVALALLGRLWRGLSGPLAYSVAAIGVVVSLGSWVLAYQVDRAVYFELGLGAQGRAAVALVMAAVVVVGLWLGPIFLIRTPLKILLMPRGTVAAWVAVVGLAGLFAAAPGPSATEVPIAPQRPPTADLGDTPDVVLITIESWRHDALPGGEAELELPGLQRLMDEGLTFTQHVATSSWHRPSLASLMTAQFPAAHGVDVVAARLEPDRLTLAEVLRERGYVTAALPARSELESALGFDQGFDWLIGFGQPADLARSESARRLLLPALLRTALRGARGLRVQREDLHRSAGEVVSAGQHFILANRRDGNRYMAWLHLAEPALPYFSADGSEVVEYRPPDRMSDQERAQAVAVYEEELGTADAALVGLLDWLDSQGVLEDTLLVVVGVHGEELFEHGGWGHGDSLFDEQIRTPLIVKLPGVGFAGQQVPWQVSIVDIAPTILAETGTTVPEAWEGRTLLPPDTLAWLHDPSLPQPAARPVLAQLYRRGAVLEALRAPPWKLLRANRSNPRGLRPDQLFDIVGDPAESYDLVGQVGATEALLSRQLRELHGLSSSWRTRPSVPRP